MKEPRRLLSHGATDFERQLLRAVANERPSALLRSRMQRGLGLVGPLAWASNVKAMLASAASKLTGTMLLGGVVAVGAVAAVASIPGSAEPERSSSRAERAGLEEQVAPRSALPAPSAPAEPAVGAPAVIAPAEPDRPASAAPEASAVGLEDADGDGQLREEIALIDAARTALQAGDRQRARERLQAYRERFPDGILKREAMVLARRAEPKRAKR